MLRREFITLASGVVAGWPLAASAQQSASPKVGYVWIGERERDVSGAGLRQGLTDKGYEIGRNLALEERYAQGDVEKVPALLAESDIFVLPSRKAPRDLNCADCLHIR